MLLYARCMITNDISSDSNAFLSAEKLIACLIFSLITFNHCMLTFNSNSSLIWIFKDNKYIAFKNVLHFLLNSIFNSFCKFCIKNSFSIWKIYTLFYWKNELLKLFEDRAHHQHDACALFWSSRIDEKRRWYNVDEWMKDDYYYLSEEFSQGERYTEEITQAASTLWA